MRRLLLISMFALIAVTVLPVAAQASTKWGCIVKYVVVSEYNNGGLHAPTLQINCDGDAISYNAYSVNTPTCGTSVGVDTLKALESLAQSALLSKRALDITYTTPSGCATNMIAAAALSAY
jgi:hypothetical protein